MRARVAEGLLGLGVLLGLALAALHACGGSTPEAGAPKRGAVLPSQSPAGVGDQARCQFEGRSDREAVETAGPGATLPNIRRVYAIVGEGETRRRVISCRLVDTNLDGIFDVVRTYNDLGESAEESVDSNFDGKFDTWHSFSKGRITKTQIDNSGDGRPDESRYYVKGKLSRVQRDTNHDGAPDVWEVYDNGHLQRMGEDLDFDGHVDRWNRDEIAARLAEAREREEEERQNQQTQAAEPGEPTDAGVTDARVSARNR
jgi:hypothetical protein